MRHDCACRFCGVHALWFTFLKRWSHPYKSIFLKEANQKTTTSKQNKTKNINYKTRKNIKKVSPVPNTFKVCRLNFYASHSCNTNVCNWNYTQESFWPLIQDRSIQHLLALRCKAVGIYIYYVCTINRQKDSFKYFCVYAYRFGLSTESSGLNQELLDH